MGKLSRPYATIALGVLLVTAGLLTRGTWLLLAGLLVTVAGGLWAAVRERGQDGDGPLRIRG